ncbi:MAG: peptidylprolyl isomerase [Gemmatimonadales bacterium]|nr:peptidylprolyl isomerase [Gemmatimonadales bacterium]
MFRRLAVLSLCLSLTGCSGLRDAITAHQDVVARAAGQQLTVNQLAQIIAPTKSVPLRRDVVDRIADLWVDYQLLAWAIGSGDSLLDSATVLAAMWPEVSQRLADRLHDSVIVRRAQLTGPQVDSAYNVGEVRWIYHILVAVKQDTTANVKAAKRRQAEGYLAQIQRGAEFQALAAQHSEDPGSGSSGGSLGLVGRGQMVKPFEDAAFALQPGQTSGIVETAFGYHILWRPALETVRDSFSMRIKDIVVLRLDSLYLDSLTNRTDVRVRGSAPAIVRGAAENLRAAKDRSRVVATYRGGRLRERDFARWLQAFPPQTRGMVMQAPDSMIIEFVKSITRNDMLLRAAQARHYRLTPQESDSIRESFRRDLALLTNTVGVSAESLASDSSARGDRRAAAGHRVDAYFAAITSNPPRRQFFEVKPFLADLLRERFRWSVSAAGVDRALERAKELRGPETPQGVPGGMTPVPGGPPVGPRPAGPPVGQPRPPVPARP